MATVDRFPPGATVSLQVLARDPHALLARLREREPVSWIRYSTVLGDLLSDVDRRTLTGEFADYLCASDRERLADGVWGWFDDDVAFVSDWGFELGRIVRPVTVWQGEQDRFVPFRPVHSQPVACGTRLWRALPAASRARPPVAGGRLVRRDPRRPAGERRLTLTAA